MENDGFLPDAVLARPDPAEKAAFTEEAYALLARRILRYTMGDSDSVPVETGEELFRGILYLADLHLRTHPEQSRAHLSVEALFTGGMEDAKRLTARAKLLWRQAKAAPQPVDNMACRDTIDGMSDFFRRYDVAFFAHQIPCSIDYPLARPVPEATLGVEYILAYLRQFLTETAFLRRYPAGDVAGLLSAYCGDYEGLLVNLYTPVAEAAIGRALAGLPVRMLGVDGTARKRIEDRFAACKDEEAAALLQAAAESVYRELSLSGESQRTLLSHVAGELLPRIRAGLSGLGLNGVFFQGT